MLVAATSPAPAATTTGRGHAPAVKSTTTTTTVPPTTTTTLVPISIPQGGPVTNPPPPGVTTTTVVPIVPIPTPVINALVKSVQSGLAQLYSINAYDEEKGIVTVYEANAASAETDAQMADAAAAQATAAVAQDQTDYTDSQHELSSLAIALYVRSDVGAASTNADASDPDTVNKTVLLGILINHGQQTFEEARLELKDDTATLKLDRQRAAVADAEEKLAREVLTKSTTQLTNTKLAAAGQKVQQTTGTPIPTIMGTAALSAGELAGWYASTGYQANTTVPLATLAGYYLSNGTTVGLRGDIAFAQSIVETGYFTFPSGGQLAGSDNNFAGIGACDSCAHGWTFPDAQTGVAAQEQLLEAYASSTKIPTPLVGRVGVAGCCNTWLALSGVWATNPNYGYEILSVYQEILNWAIPERLAAAGL